MKPESCTEHINLNTSNCIDSKSELMSALHSGNIKSLKRAINHGALQYFVASDIRKKLEFMTFLNEIIDTLHYLLKQRIAFVPLDENIKQENCTQDGIFNVTLIKGTNLVMKLQLNATVLHNWKDGQVRGRTPLHIICSLPDVKTETVQYLLNNGAYVDSQTDENIAAFHVAIEGVNIDLVKILVKSCANVNVSANISVTPRNGTKIMKLFLRDNDVLENNIDFLSTPLNAAIRTGREDIAKYLLEKGAAVESKGSWTPLQVAAFYGRDVMVRLLLEHEAEVGGRDSSGQTALHKAASSGQLAVARFLVNSGAEIDATDAYGWTPLHWAAFCSPPGGRSVVEFLLDSGAELERWNNGGYTPLELATAGEHHGLLQSLADRMETLNTTDEYVDLTEVVGDKERLELIELLLERGADTAHQDWILGWTPLHWASATGDLNIVAVLANGTVNLCARSIMGQTPQDTAKYWGRRVIYDYLKQQTNTKSCNKSDPLMTYVI